MDINSLLVLISAVLTFLVGFYAGGWSLVKRKLKKFAEAAEAFAALAKAVVVASEDPSPENLKLVLDAANVFIEKAKELFAPELALTGSFLVVLFLTAMSFIISGMFYLWFGLTYVVQLSLIFSGITAALSVLVYALSQ